MGQKPGESQPVSIKYPPHSALRTELDHRVGDYFRNEKIPPDGGLRLRLKTAIILAWFVLSYTLLVFLAATWWHGLLGALSLSLAVAGIGFNIQHDGGHGAYARSKAINRLAAMALDFTGGSSYMWAYQHNRFHHHHTNVEGMDGDLEGGLLLRLAPYQKRHRLHRFQHWYIWMLYGFMPPKWHFVDDLQGLITGRLGQRPIRRPRGGELVLFVGGKLVFLTWAFVVPLLLHPAWVVFLFYGICSLLTGATLGTVFVLAHCVDETDFAEIPPPDRRMGREWAEHQFASTSDFGPGNRWLTWYVGGLNFQIEHHLYPRVSHVHYPKLAPIVEAVANRFGAPYVSHRTLGQALASHVRFLKRMGRASHEKEAD